MTFTSNGLASFRLLVINKISKTEHTNSCKNFCKLLIKEAKPPNHVSTDSKADRPKFKRASGSEGAYQATEVAS